MKKVPDGFEDVFLAKFINFWAGVRSSKISIHSSCRVSTMAERLNKRGGPKSPGNFTHAISTQKPFDLKLVISVG